MAAPADRVKVLKVESPSTGGTDDDEGFQALIDPNEDGINVHGAFFQDTTGEDENCYIVRNGSDLVFRDITVGAEVTLDTLNSAGGGGITEPQHEALDRLTHAINETSFDEYIYTGSRVDSIITWTSAAKTLKVRQVDFTYTGSKATQIVTIQYDGAGVEKERNTEVLAYTGSKLDDVTRTHV